MTERAEIFNGWFIPDSETILPYGLRDSKGVVESYNTCIRINEVFLLYYNNKITRGSPTRNIHLQKYGSYFDQVWGSAILVQENPNTGDIVSINIDELVGLNEILKTAAAKQCADDMNCRGLSMLQSEEVETERCDNEDMEGGKTLMTYNEEQLSNYEHESIMRLYWC